MDLNAVHIILMHFIAMFGVVQLVKITEEVFSQQRCANLFTRRSTQEKEL